MSIFAVSALKQIFIAQEITINANGIQRHSAPFFAPAFD